MKKIVLVLIFDSLLFGCGSPDSSGSKTIVRSDTTQISKPASYRKDIIGAWVLKDKGSIDTLVVGGDKILSTDNGILAKYNIVNDSLIMYRDTSVYKGSGVYRAKMIIIRDTLTLIDTAGTDVLVRIK